MCRIFAVLTMPVRFDLAVFATVGSVRGETSRSENVHGGAGDDSAGGFVRGRKSVFQVSAEFCCVLNFVLSTNRDNGFSLHTVGWLSLFHSVLCRCTGNGNTEMNE